MLETSSKGEHKAATMGLVFVICFSIATGLLSIQKGQCADIVGGRESVPHSRPYMAALMKGKNVSCGGTLIKENWVLTAAHCFPDEDTYIVLGAHSQTKREKEKQIVNITKVYAYPGYSPRTFENDIMLLQLKTRAMINQAVKTIPLARTFNDLKAGTPCLVAGWGLTSDGRRPKPSNTLREVNVTVIDRHICNDKKHYKSQHLVSMNMVCAGDTKGGKDACRGDSGGPLICDKEQKGIVSFGEKCGSRQYPGVYTRLTKEYIAWIKQITGSATD